MRILRTYAFTLIELLVVISIIGILAALAIPAVAGALVKGQLTGTLNNSRQLQLATFNANLENEAAGQPGAWPSSNVNFDTWLTNLRYTLSEADLRKMFSAPRVTITNFPPQNTDGGIAFRVYQVGNTEEAGVIFISTRNWNATTPSTAPAASGPTSIPYGDKGVVIMRKGGDGQVLQQRFVTNTNTLGIPGGTNPPAL